MRRSLTLGLIAAATLTLAFAGHTRPITLAHKFRAGQIDKYKLRVDMTLKMPAMQSMPCKSMNMRMTALMRQKTLGLLEDGSARIILTYYNMKMIAPELSRVAQQDKRPHSVVMVVSRDGRILAMKDATGSPMAQTIPGLDYSNFVGHMGYCGIFPNVPVEVGQGWNCKAPMPMNSGDINFRSVITDPAAPIGKASASKIQQSFEGFLDIGSLFKAIASGSKLPFGDMKFTGGVQVSGWSTVYFSPELGKMLKVNGAADVRMTMNMPEQAVARGAPSSLAMNMGIKMNVTRV